MSEQHQEGRAAVPDLPQRMIEEDELLREGWCRRFVGGPPRLQEFVALYESLGYEVRLEPQAAEELSEECGDCTLALMLFRVVYTRPRPKGDGA